MPHARECPTDAGANADRYPMQRVCERCGCDLGPGWANRPGVVSHGTCAPCEAIIRAEWMDKMRQRIEARDGR